MVFSVDAFTFTAPHFLRGKSAHSAARTFPLASFSISNSPCELLLDLKMLGGLSFWQAPYRFFLANIYGVSRRCVHLHCPSFPARKERSFRCSGFSPCIFFHSQFAFANWLLDRRDQPPRRSAPIDSLRLSRTVREDGPYKPLICGRTMFAPTWSDGLFHHPLVGAAICRLFFRSTPHQTQPHRSAPIGSPHPQRYILIVNPTFL